MGLSMCKGMEKGMESIIDAHVHLSERNGDQLIRYARLNGLNYTMGEYLSMMKELHITAGLLLSPPQDDWQPLPNEDIIDLCRSSGWRLLPILTVEPSLGAISKALELASAPGNRVHGFKVRLGYQPVYANDGVYDPLYDYAEPRKLPVLFHTGDTAMPGGSLEHSHPLTLDRLANRRPDLRIIACHFGNPWIEDVAELIYKHENVYADISGLFAGGGKYGQAYLESMGRRLSEAVYYAGDARRIVFGSDYPVSTPAHILTLVRHLQITQEDQDSILWGNAKRLFQI